MHKTPSGKENVTLSQSNYHSHIRAMDRFFFCHARIEEMFFSIGFESVFSFGHWGRDNLAVSYHF